jgi:hypothetical protein
MISRLIEVGRPGDGSGRTALLGGPGGVLVAGVEVLLASAQGQSEVGAVLVAPGRLDQLVRRFGRRPAGSAISHADKRDIRS